ncbi:hypothetical protein Tco_0985452 [Tanacetum coccineum]
MPIVAKAYGMIRQEEKQREGFVSKIPVATALSVHSNNYRNYYNNNARGSRNYNQGESSVRGTSNNDYQMRRGVFRKGVICGNCSKEGYTREECYKLVGYPVGHPLHGKYKPPNTPRFIAQDNSVHKYVNMTIAQGTPKLVATFTTMAYRFIASHISDHHKRIAHGSLYNGLYIIKQGPITPPSTILSITNNNVAL